MKITKLRTRVVHFPFDPPIDGGALQLRSADCVLVFLETDAGLVGEGLVFALNNQRLPVINEMVRSLEPLVLGLDPELGGSFSARAFRDIGFLGRSGVAVIGVAGVDATRSGTCAARPPGLNVARLIGACATAVPAYHSGGLWIGRSIDELQREAAGFIAQGWRAMKMRIGKPRAEDDVARVRAVREAIGPDIGLMVDSNQQLTVPRAIRLGRMLEEFNLTWFEEPIPTTIMPARPRSRRRSTCRCERRDRIHQPRHVRNGAPAFRRYTDAICSAWAGRRILKAAHIAGRSTSCPRICSRDEPRAAGRAADAISSTCRGASLPTGRRITLDAQGRASRAGSARLGIWL
jgi:L-alanine-DL-glutamate epimerase-like enolase superfamily enzyme